MTQRGLNNGTRYSLAALPSWVVERIIGRLDSHFSGDIILRCHDGRILKIGYNEWEQDPDKGYRRKREPNREP